MPLTNVVETMRALPIEPIAGMPSFMRGISIIRGMPTPVVDLGAILGTLLDTGDGDAERIVTIRLGERQVALCVSAVLGIRAFDRAQIAELPPLLRGARQDFVETIGTLDEEFLMVLRDGWELPEEVWDAMSAEVTA